MSKLIYFTADVIVPDGSDTNCYGEGTLPGHGYQLETGWYDPDWSRYDVHKDRDSVRADVFDPSDTLTPAEFLAEAVAGRLNGVEFSGAPSTFYSADSDSSDYEKGRELTVAAHPEGFTEAEVNEAIALLHLAPAELARALTLAKLR